MSLEDVDALPLSFAQERLWFLDQLAPGSPAYTIVDAYRVRGALDVDALQRALTEVVRRHEILRTSFASISGRPVQVVTAAVTVTLDVTDLRAAAGDDSTELAHRLTGEAGRAISLSEAPLLRPALFRLADDEHVLTLAIHHIAYDAWSDRLLHDELADLYAAYRRGAASPLPEPELQYADFAVWQREWLSGDVLTDEVEHWRRELDGAPQLLHLPLDRPRPAVQRYRGGTVEFDLGSELTGAVRRLAAEQGVTVFMTLLAGFQALLHRYSGQASVLVGTPVVNRSRIELERLIGFFANTLVLRADLCPGQTGAELLAQVKDRALTAFAHQDLPFERLVEDLAPAREPGHNPIFQAMFALHNAASGGPRLEGVEVTREPLERDTTMFDLLLYVDEQPTGLHPQFQYNSDILDRTTVERMAGHYRRLLTALTSDPTRPLDRIDLLGADEHDQVEGWNRTDNGLDPADLPGTHQLIAAQARRTPDLVALRFRDSQLSYRELDQRSNRLAHHLRALGVGPDGRVAICMERSLELVIALLGVLKAGAAFVPLDPDYPAQRLAYMIADAAPPVVLAQRRLLGRLPDHDAMDIFLDELELGDDLPDTLPENGLNPSNLAYVMYTSGSTGRPKGVMVDHAGLTNRVLWMQDEYTLSAQDRLLQKTPYSFDVSAWEFLWPLLVGATVVLAEPGRHIEPGYIADVIERESITTIHFVPSMLDAFLDEPDLDRRCATLRRVYCSGEALTTTQRGRFVARLGAELHNEYGPTETGEITAAQCNDPDAPLTIGRPIANSTAYVVDRWLQPCPVGVPGELLLGGTALARGYHGKADLTADRYLPNPFDPAGGSRLYRTGDLCRWLPDGNLDYLGRVDQQLKIRGLRIEPAEIEAALLTHPAVRQAAVIARTDGPSRDPVLVGYLVTDDVAGVLDDDPVSDGQPVADGHREPTTAELRAHLASLLPASMVPSAFVVLPALPLTPTGKLDRRALPAPELPVRSNSTADLPRTSTEQRLATIWSEVLGMGTIGIHDSFFELGGHSLLATRVVARVRELLHVELPLRAIFEQPTIAGLATRLETPHTPAERRDDNIVPVRRAPNAPQPLSPSQWRVWFLDQLVPGSAAYAIVDARLLTGPLDVDALARALTELVRRHEALRSPVVTVDGTPMQVVADPTPVGLVAIDLARDDLTEALCGEASTPIELTSHSLLRARLWRLRPDEHVLCLSVHHVAFDEGSLDVFQAELSVLYAGFCNDELITLAPPALQYGDVAAWLRGRLDSGELQPQLDYWLAELRDAPEVLELPTDQPRPALQTYRGGRLGFSIDATLARGLKKLGRQHDATPFMAFLAAFQVLLHRLSEQATVLVGTPIANRARTELEQVVGLFANTIVMRADIAPDTDFGALLDQVRRRSLEAYTYQDLPYERLVEELDPTRAASHNPVFQVMFAYQNVDAGLLQLQEITSTPLQVENNTSKFDLTLDVYDLGDDQLRIEFEYSSDLFAPATIERLASQLQRLIAGVVADPARAISQVELLGPDELERERGWSRGGIVPAADRAVHELVADQVRRAPDAWAVCSDTERVTYAQLAARAELLAGELQRRGAGPETVVAIGLPRGVDLVVAELGVLRTGAAYLPLDIDNPSDRLAYVCDDAGALLVVTNATSSGRVPAGRPVVMLDALDPETAAPTPVPVHLAGLAYVIYTSGSTGRPKGVMVEHRSLANVVDWRARRCGLGPTDRTAMIASPGFDASVTDIWSPLTRGACIWVPDQETRLTPARLQGWLVDRGVTVTEVATPLAELLLALPWPSSGALRVLITGGDRLHSRPAGDLGFRLLNEYGPTENTATSTAGEVSPARDGNGEGLPGIGGPIAGTSAYVTDRWLTPNGIGAPGQLLLGGRGVTRGYLGRPDLTAERFLPDPFADVPGSRMYVSGDLVRRRPDGALDFLGRTDRQVKIRGFRIELGEITAALRSHPRVADAWVKVWDGGVPGHRALAAYLVPTIGSPAPTADELRGHLARDLPSHMLPAAYVSLPALPVNRSGKVDEAALPMPQAGAGARLTAPVGPLEARLVEIWRDVLGLARVGVDDSFFDLGGHSLLLAQVHARLLGELEQPVPMVRLFEHPTIRSLARFLDGRSTSDRPASAESAGERSGPDRPSAERLTQLRAGRQRLNRRAQRPTTTTTTARGDSHVR